MQRAQGAAGAGFDFDRHDPGSPGNRVVNFGVGTFPFPQPVVQPGRFPTLCQVEQVLPDELLCQGPFIDHLVDTNGLSDTGSGAGED